MALLPGVSGSSSSGVGISLPAIRGGRSAPRKFGFTPEAVVALDPAGQRRSLPHVAAAPALTFGNVHGVYNEAGPSPALAEETALGANRGRMVVR